MHEWLASEAAAAPAAAPATAPTAAPAAAAAASLSESRLSFHILLLHPPADLKESR